MKRFLLLLFCPWRCDHNGLPAASRAPRVFEQRATCLTCGKAVYEPIARIGDLRMAAILPPHAAVPYYLWRERSKD